jgi:UDP-N-acetylglucosamine--N-acetylmuramyl-(pentapeptide) pyrophosphoryl-undecaprenol N-acetylglucosamine transferase
MSTLLVAATGGHLAQLHRLAPRIAPRDERRWVTFDTPQSRSLLAEEPHLLVPYIAPRDWPGVLRESRRAMGLLRRERPRLVVSTGNAIALSYIPVARALEIPAVYIESAARALGPSLTGRLIRRVPGVQLYTQYQAQADDVWGYAGSVFDDFTPEDRPGEAGPLRNVFVTLGTIPFPFPRALDAVTRVLPDGCELSCQVGATMASGMSGETMPTMSAAGIRARVAAADVVVAHAGIGSALDILQAGKTPVLLVRSSAHGEHVDDHQEQIARTLSDLGLAIWRRPEDLTTDDLRWAAGRRVRVGASNAALDLRRS